MLEGIDPKLYEKYNKKLEEDGMPENLKAVEPADSLKTASGILMDIVPEIEPLLFQFKELPSKLQKDVINDLAKQRKIGLPASQILDRFQILMAKSKELLELSPDSSDIKYTPKTSSEVDKAYQERRALAVDALIAQAERIAKYEAH